MRALIAKEKGEADPWDLKLAAGGLTDLDFLAQALVLAHAGTHTELIGRPTEPVLESAGQLGLLDPADASVLVDAHRLFNDVHQWQRLAIEGRFSADAVPPPILKRLALVAGLPDEKVLLEHLKETQRRVRSIFDDVLGA